MLQWMKRLFDGETVAPAPPPIAFKPPLDLWYPRVKCLMPILEGRDDIKGILFENTEDRIAISVFGATAHRFTVLLTVDDCKDWKANLDVIDQIVSSRICAALEPIQ